MKTSKNFISTINNRQGVTAILVSLTMLALISFAALAVDIGYILTTKNELQNIADAAALAAARKLADIYPPPIDPSPARTAAQEVAQSNWAGGIDGITINDADIEIGIWNGNTFSITLTLPNAARITVRRDSSANGPITTFFAKLFGINSVDIQAKAIAALSGHAVIPGQTFSYVVEGRGNSIFPENPGFLGTMGSIPSLVK